MPCTRALVWFKRDLRRQDHAALTAAQGCDDAAGIFIIEPQWLQSPECDAMHVAFALDCLAELRESLARHGMPLLVRVGPAVEVLAQLHAELSWTHLFSHEETGPGWSYVRDRAVAAWCGSRALLWQEFAQTGVVRRLRSRSGWAARWQARMDAPQLPPVGRLQPAASLDQPALPTLAQLGLAPHGRMLQPAGERAALATLRSFLQTRGHDYRRALSSPLSATDACSRLSPHLAFGTVSMRRVHQSTEAAIAGTADRAMAHALRGFAGRLRWHCHFMQKLEDEPDIEFRNFARVCDGLREDYFDEALFAAWCAGRTGYPMVDACMRSLRATGWLNFRMRAMLVSFASYHLWLHWRRPGLFLARQFLDFEPGIHWSQMQMQSGTTGINTLRIYSPTKQAQDHDPEGHFIRRWVPELARVPLPWLARPWLMDAAAQAAAGCRMGKDYPHPVVDEKAALQAARERLYGLRATPQARAEADAVQARHGSRKSGLPPARRPGAQTAGRAAMPPRVMPSPQGDLFA
jgi:deoxyribodipyrimidine photo-lyase